jgi:hypothetical protein
MTNDKIYLGDAVYADCDGYHIVLTTEDGVSTTNRICLEPSVWVALLRYVNHLAQRQAKLDSLADQRGDEPT